MTSVHVLPAGETAEDHTLGECPCGPRKRSRHRGDGTVIDEFLLHRSRDDEAGAE